MIRSKGATKPRYKALQSSSTTYVCQTQITRERKISAIRTNLHTIWYQRVDLYSLAPALPHRGTSSTTATVPRRSIANRRCNRRLHMCANRKLHSSKLFRRPGPTYTPYHMMAESRPLCLLLCLIGAPLRLRRRYHADPLLTGAAIVVYICVPIANYTVASSFADQDQPTHHTI
jgi:hypothetical protein